MSDSHFAEYDPFHRPSPYDILEIKNGLKASAKEIGQAYNKLKRKARQLKDVKERAARMEALDRAKEQLQRPENRVLIDFFMLGDDLFADLCDRLGERLSRREIPTRKALGKLLSGGRFDDLLPHPLDQFTREFELIEDAQWFDEPYADDEPLEITTIE